jgi:SAM-dependent methyltransferase
VSASDPTRRFSDRVQSYVRYRPGYPEAALDFLAAACPPSPAVADVGMGTGILTEALLRRGWSVWGVEPNLEMRQAAEQNLSSWETFTSVAGRAEETGLASGLVDLVTAAQAFHWFDRPAARREFARILRPGGWLALLWNNRRKSGSAFLEGYEGLLRRWSVDYTEVDHSQVTDAAVSAFFAPGRCELRLFPNRQVFDLKGTCGRLASSSYAPAPGHPNHAPMMAELHDLFGRCAERGTVTFEYDTLVYLGGLDPA